MGIVSMDILLMLILKDVLSLSQSLLIVLINFITSTVVNNSLGGVKVDFDRSLALALTLRLILELTMELTLGIDQLEEVIS